MTLQEVLLDDGRPFCSHYGAVVGLTELGSEVLEGGVGGAWVEVVETLRSATSNLSEMKYR